MNVHVRRIAFSRCRGRGAFRRGGAILEAALVLPILLALSFGMVEYGYYFFVKHTLQGAARDGARIPALQGKYLFQKERLQPPRRGGEERLRRA